MLLNWIEDVVC